MEMLSGHILQPSGANLANVGSLFSDYISGINSSLAVHGDYVAPDGTDQVAWLSTAFKTLILDVVLPGVKETLVTATHIEFPTNIATNGGIAQATFGLANPFGATITLESIIANATHDGFYLGIINIPSLSNPIVAPGHDNITSPSEPLEFDIDPVHIIQLLGLLAGERNVNLGPLPELFEIVLSNPTYHPPINATYVTSGGGDGCSSGQQFDVDGAILATLQGLLVDLVIQSNVKLDDITVPLHFTQTGVPAITDNTALYLITVVAPPIVQTLVNNATLAFSEANITDVTNDGFSLSLTGQLLDTGPLDALISFPEPLTVTWNDQNIAAISLPPICAAANSGVPDLKTNANLTITNQEGFASFASYLLHNKNFTWTVSSKNVQVEALNIIFTGVSLSKDLNFAGFDGLPGVTISNFNLPSDDPAGGITLSTDSMIPSLSNLGVDLGNVGFEAFYNGVDLGPLTASGLVLAPLATTTEHLSGRLIPQSGNALNVVGDLFSDYLAGDNSTLQVKGSYVDGAQSSPVTWLTTAFQSLTLDVILPGHIYQIIYSIALNDLELTMTTSGEAFAPLTGTKDTVATFKNPFGFSLKPIDSAENITLGFQGVDVAQLNVPSQAVDAGTSTGNLADLTLAFQNIPLTSLNDEAFALFFAAVTDTQGIDPSLKGTVAIVAQTTIGDVPIHGIPFNVSSSITGIHSFGGQVGITNASISGSGGNGAYITAPLTATLDNPSNITLTTNDVSLAAYYQGTYVGRAVLDPLDLLPGSHPYPATFEYEPANSNDTIAQQFLEAYLETTNALDLTVKGDGNSSPYPSLVPALEGVSLAGSLTGIGTRLVTVVNVYISAGTLFTNEVQVNFDVQNPLDTEISIEFVQNDSGVNGEIYAHFDQGFNGFTIPAHGTANSGTFDHVKLTKGALATLPIILDGYLDLANALTVSVGGYVVPWLHYNEKRVTTNYHVDLLGVSASGPEVISVVQSALQQSTQSLASLASVKAASLLSVTSVLDKTTAIAPITSSLAAQASSAIAPVTSAIAPVTSAIAKVTSALNALPTL